MTYLIIGMINCSISVYAIWKEKSTAMILTFLIWGVLCFLSFDHNEIERQIEELEVVCGEGDE